MHQARPLRSGQPDLRSAANSFGGYHRRHPTKMPRIQNFASPVGVLLKLHPPKNTSGLIRYYGFVSRIILQTVLLGLISH